MTHVTLLKAPTTSPADVATPLAALTSYLSTTASPSSGLLAVIGKTEGNGCVNDFSRTLAAHAWAPHLPAGAISIFSGGTEGVLSPHVTLLVTTPHPTGLVAAVGKTRAFAPWEVGAPAMARAVAGCVRGLLAEGKIAEEDVRLVLIKCPLLTSAKLAAAAREGRRCVTEDTYESMARSRYSAAVGIGAALGEIAEGDVDAAIERGDRWSAKASCSAGAELEGCHVLVLAATSTPARSGSGPLLRALTTPMRSALDSSTLLSVLERVRAEGGRVRQVFVKAEADPRGTLEGSGARHTMNTDSDLHSTRHARAAVGGLVAGLVGDPHVYVSGGAEGQGPVGGGSLCVVYEVDGEKARL